MECAPVSVPEIADLVSMPAAAVEALAHAVDVRPHGRHGPTNVANGAPLCEHHNIWKNQGFRTWRDSHALWHTYRPDGTEIGWPTYRLHLPQIGAD